MLTSDYERQQREHYHGGKELDIEATSHHELELFSRLALNELQVKLIGVCVSIKDVDCTYRLYAKDARTNKPILKASILPLTFFLRGIDATLRSR